MPGKKSSSSLNSNPFSSNPPANTRQVTGQVKTKGFTVQRPQTIGSDQRQMVVFARDSSYSMSGEKSADASRASMELAEELAMPFNKDAFDMAMIDFNHGSRVVLAPAKATAALSQLAPIRPGGMGTNITSALETALSILESPMPFEAPYARPVVLLFSDGQHNQAGDPADPARRIREQADLVTVAFGEGDEVDETLLEEIATSPRHCYRCTDGKQLRAFLAEVGQTLGTTRAAGIVATRALGKMTTGARKTR